MNQTTDNNTEYESTEKSSRVTAYLREKLNTPEEEHDEFKTSLLKYLLYANPNQAGLLVQSDASQDKKTTVNSNLAKIDKRITTWLTDSNSNSTETLDYSQFENFAERIHVKSRVVFATSSILDAIELCNLVLTKLHIEESHGKEWPPRDRDNGKLVKRDGVADFSKSNIKSLIKKLSKLLTDELPTIVNDMYEAHYTKYGKFSYNDHKIKMHLAANGIVQSFTDYLGERFLPSLKTILTGFSERFGDEANFGQLYLHDGSEVSSSNYGQKLGALLEYLEDKRYISREESHSFYENFMKKKSSDKDKVLAVRKMVELSQPRKKYILRKWFYVNTISDNTTYGECFLKFVQSFAVCLSKKLFGKGGKKLTDKEPMEIRAYMDQIFTLIQSKLNDTSLGVSRDKIQSINLEIQICKMTNDKDRLQESIKTVFLEYLSFDGDLPKFHELENIGDLLQIPKIRRFMELISILKDSKFFDRISLSVRFVELDVLFSYFGNGQRELTYQRFLDDVEKLFRSLGTESGQYVINDVLANLIFNIFNITFQQQSHETTKGKSEKFKTITDPSLSGNIKSALGEKLIQDMKTSNSIHLVSDTNGQEYIQFVQKFVLTAVSKIKVTTSEPLEKSGFKPEYDRARKFINRLQHYIDIANQSFSSLKETIDTIKKRKITSDKKLEKENILNLRQQSLPQSSFVENKSSSVQYVNSPLAQSQSQGLVQTPNNVVVTTGNQSAAAAVTEDNPFAAATSPAPVVVTEDNPFGAVTETQPGSPSSGRSRTNSVGLPLPPSNGGQGLYNLLSLSDRSLYSGPKSPRSEEVNSQPMNTFGGLSQQQTGLASPSPVLQPNRNFLG